MTFGWQDAEDLAAEHMRNTLRFHDARRTRNGADGGLDVRATEAGAQVKFFASTVGIADVQRLKGTVRPGQHAVFYATLAGYTKTAREFARTAGVALFRYTQGGLVAADNAHASALLKLRSRVELPSPSDVELTPAERRAMQNRVLELGHLISNYSTLVRDLSLARGEQLALLRKFIENSSTAGDEQYVRGRYKVWIEHYEAGIFYPSVQAFQDMAKENFPPGQFTEDPTPIVEHRTEILKALAGCLDGVFATLPLERNAAEKWQKYWTDHRFSRWDATEEGGWPYDPELCSCGTSLSDCSHPMLRDDLVSAAVLPPGPHVATMWPPRRIP